jgi:hypothetical protein
MSGIVLSYYAAASGGSFLGDAKPSVLDICWSAYRLGTCVIEFLDGHVIFTRVSLPYGGVLVVCMRIFLIELPFQTAIGWIPVLQYMLLGVHRLLQTCPISPGNECYRLLRP